MDQDSPWESATGRAVAPRAEADHSRQPGVEGPLAEWCAQHAEDSKQVAEPRGSFIVVGPRGQWRKELEAALTRVRAQLKPKPRVSTSPDVAIEEAKLKVTRLEKALEAMADSSGAEVD